MNRRRGGDMAVGEVFRALGAVAEPPRPELQAVTEALGLGPLPSAAAHSDLFVLQLYPYASVYLGAEGMMGGEAADRIAGFWRALGQVPPSEPDHLTLLLGFHARLSEMAGAGPPSGDGGQGGPDWRRVREAFFWEHLMSWLPVFLTKLESLEEAAVDPFYRRWGALLRAALHEEAAALRPSSPGSWLSLHLREAPEMSDPRRDGAEAFLAALLSPVRSGMILTRSDLARAARSLGLAARVIDRRRVTLATLLESDASAALEWLAAEATVWTAQHRLEVHGAAAPLALFWQTRAAATALLLRSLAADAAY